jgi:predicted metal-dependent enzyme (double-stranded beta helix superfamily)
MIPVTQEPMNPWPAVAIPLPPERGRSAVLEIEDAVRAAALRVPIGITASCHPPSPKAETIACEAVIPMGSLSPHEAVARILERRVTEPALLDGVHCPGSPDRYTRHLVYAGPGFSILALVWLPGQMSPIHGHRSWCALGIRQGTLVETCFTREDARLTLDACRQLQPGMVSHSDGDDDHYHRVANLGVETAVSIHVYGVAFDRLGHGLNRMWEEEP